MPESSSGWPLLLLLLPMLLLLAALLLVAALLAWPLAVAGGRKTMPSLSHSLTCIAATAAVQ
jgi:hypothetical protein